MAFIALHEQVGVVGGRHGHVRVDDVELGRVHGGGAEDGHISLHLHVHPHLREEAGGGGEAGGSWSVSHEEVSVGKEYVGIRRTIMLRVWHVKK